MKEIVKVANKYMLVNNKFIPGVYLKQLGFTYGACSPLAGA